MAVRADDLGRDDLIEMLHAFYASVREDDGELGELFASEVPDWDAHLEAMLGFWCKAIVDGPDTPIPAPPGLLYGLTRTSLARWHQLFTKATSATLRPEQAIRLRELSAQVSDRQSGL